MQLGMVGLGRMGANMTRRLVRGGHQLVVSDLSADAVKQLAGEGAAGSASLEDLIANLKPPRAVWIMVPAGGPTEATVQKLAQYMQAGDAIIDGGNSYFKDDVRRAHPYSVYPELAFDVPTREEGDTYARYLIRLDEIKQSIHIIDQCLHKMPDGPVMAKLPRSWCRRLKVSTPATLLTFRTTNR